MVAREKILVRGVNWLGDAVMTTPALQRLREARPAAHITLLTHAKLADLWHGHPSLDAVLEFSGDHSVFHVARRLRTEQFARAILLPNSPRSALEAVLASVPERIGYARGGRRLLLTQRVPERPDAIRMHKRTVPEIQQRVARHLPRETFPSSAHQVHEYLHLMSALGADPAPVAPFLHVDPEEISSALRRFGVSAEVPLFGLNPGAEYGPAKRWPKERFISAAAELQARTGCQWIIFGGTADAETALDIERSILSPTTNRKVINVAGRTSLRELCALLKACHLVVTNDTGPMHLAAGVGTPVIVPFGSTSPELTGPTLGAATPHRPLVGAAACAPCFRRECPIDFRCMQNITVADVVKAALEVWQLRAGRKLT